MIVQLEFECNLIIFRCNLVEDMVDLGDQYDGVIASEILEHVTDAKKFMSSCCQLVKVTICQVLRSNHAVS